MKHFYFLFFFAPTLILPVAIHADDKREGATNLKIREGLQKTSDVALPTLTLRRWIMDERVIDFEDLTTAPSGTWHIVRFQPIFPSIVLIEQKAHLDPVTKAVTIQPNSDSKPLLKGKYTYRRLGETSVEPTEKTYRVLVPLELSPIGSGPPQRREYVRATPLFVGGNTLVAIHAPQEQDNPYQFSPIYALPEEWNSYLEEAAVVKEVSSDLLSSKNPFLCLRSFRKISAENPVPSSQNMGNLVACISESHGLKKAILLAELVAVQRNRPSKDEGSPDSERVMKEFATQIVAQSSPMDMRYMLIALQEVGIAYMTDPTTGRKAPGLGPAVLRQVVLRTQTLSKAPKELGLDKVTELLREFDLNETISEPVGQGH